MGGEGEWGGNIVGFVSFFVSCEVGKERSGSLMCVFVFGKLMGLWMRRRWFNFGCVCVWGIVIKLLLGVMLIYFRLLWCC